MELRMLKNSDRNMVDEFLKEHELGCAFFIGNINNYGLENDYSSRRSGDYYGGFDDGELVSIMAYYNMGSLIYFSINQNVHKLNADSIRQMAHKPKPYIGMSKSVMPLLKELSNDVDINIIKDSYYMILNKDKFNPHSINREIKDIKEIKKDAVVEFLMDVEKGFGRNVEDIDGIYQSKITRKDDREKHFILIKDGVPVSQALIQAITPNYAQIGGVFTKEDSRGLGYAGQVMSKICTEIINMGKVPTLFVRKNNPPAIRLYEKLGFEVYDDFVIAE